MKKIKLLITSAALLVGGGLLASSSNNIMKANAAEDTKTIVYSVTDRNKVTASGDIIEGANATLNNTYNGDKFDQITKGNSMTFNLSNIPESYVITNITLKTHTNKSSGAGNITISVGDVVEYDNVRYSKPNSATYVDYSFDINNLSGDVSVILKCTTNSLYCNTFSITYRSQEKYNINFYDGESLLGSQTVEGGDLIDFSSVNIEKDGYVFEGWYEDPEFTIAYDEDAPVTEDLNLYANYIAHEDLTTGEIFASETTKTSLVANTLNENIKESKVIEFNKVKDLNDGENFIFNGKNSLDKLGLNGWTYDSTNNGYTTYPTIGFTNNTFRLYTSDNHSSVTFKYPSGIISSITFTDIGNLNKIEIYDDLNQIVNHDSNGKYVFINPTTSFKIYNKNSTTTELSGSLTIDYETNKIQVNSASIRFGTTLDSKLYDAFAKYGVVFGLAGEDLNTLAEGKKTIDELALPYREVDHGTIAKVDEEGALEESDTPETAQYFQYAIVVNNMLAHIDEKITAACYMQTTDGLYVMNEVTYSLRSLAQKYIDNHYADESIDVLNAIVGYKA